MKEFFKSILSSEKSSLSSIRYIALLWNLGVFVIWGIISIIKLDIQIIPESIVTILVLVTFGKVAQKFGEKSNI